MKTRTIRQSITFKTTPHEVYEALMDSRKHSRFTGAEAKISRRVGGKFTTFDEQISGTILELVPEKKIVLSWRGGIDFWPEGHYSRVTFWLEKIKVGTRLRFTQSGVPDETYDIWDQGWRDYYWKPMKELLEK
jgi:activator of HSP90 ATPase